LCLPVYPVWHLQMSRRSKSAVFGMFLLGGLWESHSYFWGGSADDFSVIIVSILRFVFLLSVNPHDLTCKLNSWSYLRPWSPYWLPSGSYYGINLWSCVEVNAAVISACLPTLRPLARRLFPAAFVTRILGSQKRKGLKADETNSCHTFRKSPSIEHGEEFQRLPDHTSEATPIRYPAKTHSLPTQEPDVDVLELKAITKSRSEIEVDNSIPTHQGSYSWKPLSMAIVSCALPLDSQTKKKHWGLR